MARVVIVRTKRGDTYTEGRLCVDGDPFCDTLEPRDGGLTQHTPLAEIVAAKAKGTVAIPAGTYPLTLDIVSPRYSSSPFMRRVANGGRVPRLLDVPGFDGILIHTGNSAADSDGCILVGQKDSDGHLANSRNTFTLLYALLRMAAVDGVSADGGGDAADGVSADGGSGGALTIEILSE